MINTKAVISDCAKKCSIEIFGFKENAFVALFPYYVENEKGNISIYARSVDYHSVIKKRLEPIKNEFIASGAKNAYIHCDNGEENDREAAYLAGLGFYGKNGMLINDKYGSYFFIGQVIHDLSTECDKPLEKNCYGCNKCIESCPGGALSNSGFDICRCLSDITQKKGELSKAERELIKKGGMCWGCDVCQKVCPHNKNLKTNAIKEFHEKRITSFSFKDLSLMSSRQFKKLYGSYAFAWRGLAPIKRNLEILSEDVYE